MTNAIAHALTPAERRNAARLLDCLTSIRDALLGLTAVAEYKGRALSTGDVAALESHAGDEESYARHLAESNAEREMLYGALIDPQGVRESAIRSEEVVEHLPEAQRQPVCDRVDEIRRLTRRLREQVEFNIQMARRSCDHVQGLISILYGAASLTGYDARGRARLGEGGVALVNRRA